MTWLHMEFVLIFITGPSQIGQKGSAAADDAHLAVPNLSKLQKVDSIKEESCLKVPFWSCQHAKN